MDLYFVDGFENHSKQYQGFAKLVVALSTGSIAFLTRLLVDHETKQSGGLSGESGTSQRYTENIIASCPPVIMLLSLSVLLLLVFMLLQTHIFEGYCKAKQRNEPVGKRGFIYPLHLTAGWMGFVNFVAAYGYLSLRILETK